MSKAVIQIKDLKKYFGKVKAVDGISFDIEKGEIFGFLGPNGAGKTTTIRCIMNFLYPTLGSISILGKDAVKDSVFLKSKIGYLPGNVSLNNNWTGKSHIEYIESIRGKSENARELAKKFDLDLSKKFKNLSSGNKQKLGLVLALMSDPEIVIMDEPTVGLDPLLQNLIYEVLEDLRKKGATILISSHNLSEVERLCDRVGIIKAGKMVTVEPVAKLEGKKLHRVEVRFSDKYQKEEFKVKGVDTIEEITGGFIFTVGGDLNPLLQKITKHKITDIEITHANLEEIFLKFYEGGPK
ncbi:MAG: ABC transporter ATP-binding protein [bacterium]|nr:ABC transporter ATP-binding protein [bacterium]